MRLSVYSLQFTVYSLQFLVCFFISTEGTQTCLLTETCPQGAARGPAGRFFMMIMIYADILINHNNLRMRLRRISVLLTRSERSLPVN